MIIVKIKKLRINLANLAGYTPITSEHQICFFLGQHKSYLNFETREERDEIISQLDALSQEYALQYSTLLNTAINQASTPQLVEVA